MAPQRLHQFCGWRGARGQALFQHIDAALVERGIQTSIRDHRPDAGLVEDSYATDPDLLPEIDFRVARFLDVPLSVVRNVEAALMPPSYSGSQLRRFRDIDRDRLGPAIHTAIQVAGAVIRNLRDTGPAEILPIDALEWRRLLTPREGRPVQLDDILRDLWNKGIPVVPLEVLPTPSFQGLVCIVDEHPVIVLGHRYDEPGRVAFLVAHEAAHITFGDCSADTLVLDENEAVQDDSEMEQAADRYAMRLLVGELTSGISEDEEMDAKSLAQKAVDLENQNGADASSIIYAWAAQTLNYATATMAVKALYRSVGGRRQVRRLFDRIRRLRLPRRE